MESTRKSGRQFSSRSPSIFTNGGDWTNSMNLFKTSGGMKKTADGTVSIPFPKPAVGSMDTGLQHRSPRQAERLDLDGLQTASPGRPLLHQKLSAQARLKSRTPVPGKSQSTT